MKVLIADLFSQSAIEEIQLCGIELVYKHQLNGDSLASELSRFAPEILVVRSTKVTSQHINASPTLEFIIRAGAGTDNIDCRAASGKGIYVANCPGKNSIAVAELVLGLMLAIDRRIPEGVSLLKQGKWNKGMFSECSGLKGRKLGIIGLGAIGKEVSVRAKSFGLEVYGTDPSVTPSQAQSLGIEYCPSALDLARISDIITFHVPATPETRGLINSAFISNCKENVTLINTSRGDIANEQELLYELNQRPGLWYACDVYQGEPAAKEGDFMHALAQHPRVYGTHHIGASTKQAENAIGQEALRMILMYYRTRKVDPSNLVNMQVRPLANYSVIVRHYGQHGALTTLMELLKEAEFRILDFENKAFKDGASFKAIINIDCNNPLYLEGIVKILSEQEDVIHCNVVHL
ncbi:unnamed protein product [Blepharisma stoltei]|uniref:Phosphoglycerate dehydrogenase n=1 Tax=Blepharisma stoltei TaxID=1481888 RepID=A0AAU9JF04_9CILI|nr:unnamed protein product [Blepharisma stoltei]